LSHDGGQVVVEGESFSHQTERRERYGIDVAIRTTSCDEVLLSLQALRRTFSLRDRGRELPKYFNTPRVALLSREESASSLERMVTPERRG